LHQVIGALFLRSFSTVGREKGRFARKAMKSAIARKPSIHQPSKANAKRRETVEMDIPEL
jgi:transposase